VLNCHGFQAVDIIIFTQFFLLLRRKGIGGGLNKYTSPFPSPQKRGGLEREIEVVSRKIFI